MVRNKVETQERILDAAVRVLARDGVFALGMNAIAREAGVGKPLLYRYFGDLDGVLQALGARTSLASGELDAGYSALQDKLGSGGYVSPDDVLRDLIGVGRAMGSGRLSRDMILLSMAGAAGVADGPAPPREDSDRAAHYALLKAAIAFILLYRDQNQQWAGLPLKTPSDMARLEKALADLVQRTWE